MRTQKPQSGEEGLKDENTEPTVRGGGVEG